MCRPPLEITEVTKHVYDRGHHQIWRLRVDQPPLFFFFLSNITFLHCDAFSVKESNPMTMGPKKTSSALGRVCTDASNEFCTQAMNWIKLFVRDLLFFF